MVVTIGRKSQIVIAIANLNPIGIFQNTFMKSLLLKKEIPGISSTFSAIPATGNQGRFQKKLL